MVHIPKLFAAVDGVQFFAGRRLYILRSGVYPTRNGAIVVMNSDDNELEFKLTVNMANARPVSVRLPEDQFCVKVSLHEVQERVLETGFFEPTGEWVEAGDGLMRRASRYADIWRFKDCQHGTAKPSPAVLCRQCRRAHAERVTTWKTHRTAREAISRLRGNKIDL